VQQEQEQQQEHQLRSCQQTSHVQVPPGIQYACEAAAAAAAAAAVRPAVGVPGLEAAVLLLLVLLLLLLLEHPRFLLLLPLLPCLHPPFLHLLLPRCPPDMMLHHPHHLLHPAAAPTRLPAVLRLAVCCRGPLQALRWPG
jgi:hypothetical protein